MLATFLQAALLAAHAACAAPLTPNLIPDPGFEGKNAWSLTSWEACEFKSEYVAEAHGGQTAVHLHAIRPGQHDRISALAISQPFAVTGGQEYLLSLSPANRTPGYLIAVNPSEDKTIEAVVRLQTPLPQLPELEEMHRAMRRVKVAGNEVTLKLEPMQVGVYLLPSE